MSERYEFIDAEYAVTPAGKLRVVTRVPGGLKPQLFVRGVEAIK